jgi:hypothetical protein
MMRKLLAAVFAFAMAATLASTAGAITRGGTLDGDDHPYVGLMVNIGPNGPVSRCSGTLISPTVYVTAGHCTEGAVRVEIWFDSDVEAGLGTNGYPFTGDVGGTPYDHPLYLPEAFYLYDLGVVVLDKPYVLDEYAQLPEPGVVDTLPRGRNAPGVTAVGYGLQAASVNGKKDRAERVRYQADLKIVDTNGVAGIGKIPGSNSMTVSGDAKHGGTCFGDSGGAFLIEDTNILVGVTSFGLNGNCAGIGGVFRIDRDLELGFIESF